MNQLFKIVTFTTLFIALFSCRTAQELIEKAKEKDPNIILCKDSIVETLIQGETITLYGKDSVHIKTNRVDILAVYDSLGIKVSYTLKDIIITSTEITPVITSKKTRQEVRQEEKTKRKEIKANNKLDRKKEKTKKAEIKAKEKTAQIKVKKENKGKRWLNMFFVGIIVGAIGMFFFITKIWRG